MRTRSVTRITEAEVLRAIREWLSLNGFCHFRMNTGLIMQTYKGKTRPIRFGTPGMADILVLLAPRGAALWLEVKKPRGPRGGGGSEQSPDQVAFQRQVEAAGSHYAVVRSFDDVHEAIQRLEFGDPARPQAGENEGDGR